MPNHRKSMETDDGTFAGAARLDAVNTNDVLIAARVYDLSFPAGAWLGIWDLGTTYNIGEVVNDGTGAIYVSLQNGNKKNSPSTSPTWWENTHWNIHNGGAMVGGTAVIGASLATLTLPVGATALNSTFDGPRVWMDHTAFVTDPWRYSVAVRYASTAGGDGNSLGQPLLYRGADQTTVTKAGIFTGVGATQGELQGMTEAGLVGLASAAGLVVAPTSWVRLRVMGHVCEWYYGTGIGSYLPTSWTLFRKLAIDPTGAGRAAYQYMGFLLSQDVALGGAVSHVVTIGNVHIWDETT